LLSVPNFNNKQLLLFMSASFFPGLTLKNYGAAILDFTQAEANVILVLATTACCIVLFTFGLISAQAKSENESKLLDRTKKMVGNSLIPMVCLPVIAALHLYSGLEPSQLLPLVETLVDFIGG